MARHRRVGSYGALLATGIIFGVLGALLAIAGGFVAVLAFTGDSNGDYVFVVVGGGTFISGLLVIAFGEILLALRDIARNTARIP